MRTKKQVSVPAKVIVQTEIFCDLCGAVVPTSPRRDGEGATVSLQEAEGCFEHGSSTITTFDVCPECFRTRVVEWFSAAGVAPTVETSEW